MKFVEAANNFTKFLGLTNNFFRKNFMKFVDCKSDFGAWKFFFSKFHSFKYFNW